MNIKKTSAVTGLSVLFCLIIFSIHTNAQTENAKLTQVLVQKTVIGAWQLNAAESDDVAKKVAQMVATAKAPEKESLATDEKEPPIVSISLIAPEKLLVEADSEEKAVVLNEGYSNITVTRKILADDQTHEVELEPGTNINIKASGKPDELIVQTISPRRNTLTETYAVTPDGKKLKVTIRVVDQDSKEILTLHRVYDRSLVNIFSDGNAAEY